MLSWWKSMNPLISLAESGLSNLRPCFTLKDRRSCLTIIREEWEGYYSSVSPWSRSEDLCIIDGSQDARRHSSFPLESDQSNDLVREYWQNWRPVYSLHT